MNCTVLVCNKSQPSTVCINNISLLKRSQQQRVTASIPNNAHHLPILVTPLASTVFQSQQHCHVKVRKMFTLRNIDPKSSADQLKGTIRAQLKKAGDFVINCSNMIGIQTQADLAESLVRGSLRYMV